MTLLSSPSFLAAQSVYLPTSHEVYPFLKRLEARGFLKNYRDAAKPLSRREIARQLLSIENSLGELSHTERDTYEFLRAEFSYELASLAGDQQPTDFRWHLMSLDLTQGIMNIDLNGKLGWTEGKGKNVRVRSQGGKAYGYVFNNVGFFFNFVDNREAGTGINPTKEHTADPGVVLTKSARDVIEYNTTEAQLTFQAGDFQFSLEKTQNVWGFGTRGNVILSSKAPSYPQLKMRVPLSKWLDFVYIHADLNSNVIDSVRSYTTGGFFRPVYRQKYLAAHFIEFTVTPGLDISLGESVIYSDKGIQLIYLLPVMFIKSGEHYNRDTDNVQWFGGVDINLIPKVNFYLSFLIDELTTDDLLRPGQARNQLGYTAGLHTYDLGIPNTEFTIEYTRLNPWVYSHKYPAATFTNNGYDLGHWIGQNADDLYLEISHTPGRAFRFGSFFEHYRKGGLKDVSFQYRLPSQSFLYGPLHEERSFGLTGRWQFVRDGFIDVRLRRLRVGDEGNPALNRGTLTEFSLEARYGAW